MSRYKYRKHHLAVALIFLLASTCPASAIAADTDGKYSDNIPASKYKAGYSNIKRTGGSGSVSGQLLADDKIKKSYYRSNRIQNNLQPYYDFKQRIHKDHGISFGLDYSALGQWSTASLTEVKKVSGGNFRFYGQWALNNRGKKNEGKLVWKIENRHAYGDSIKPEDFGVEIGLILFTTLFNDYGWGVTNLEWQQHFNNGKTFLAIGQVDPTDWYDTYLLANPWTDLKNGAMQYATVSPPNQGFGAMGFTMIGDRVYAMAGLSDANGQPFEWGYDTFFKVGEYFTYGEVGFVSDQGDMFNDNIHFSVWHQDEKTVDEDSPTPEGWGVSFSSTWLLQDRWRPFARLGWSDGGGGAAGKAAVTVGSGIILPNHDTFTFAINWTDPSNEEFRKSVILETYYRFQLSENIAIWPNLQVAFNPANNPEKDSLAVFSLTSRFVF